jgi:site-specific DNA-methyltransferase (adenine-specific)
MQITNKQIKELIPYQNNPRKNERAVDAVAASIKQFGFKQPIVIDKDNVIVCGHTRYKAAQKLRLKEVPCIMADDLTDDQIKAFRLADNKTAELAEWDFPLLDLELADIDLDMSEFGFEFGTDDIEDFDYNVDEKTDSEYDEKEENYVECPCCGMRFIP